MNKSLHKAFNALGRFKVIKPAFPLVSVKIWVYDFSSVVPATASVIFLRFRIKRVILLYRQLTSLNKGSRESSGNDSVGGQRSGDGGANESSKHTEEKRKIF